MKFREIVSKILRRIIFPRLYEERYSHNHIPEGITERELRYETIQKVFKIISSNLDLNDVTQRVVDVMSNDMDYPGGILFIYKKERDVLVPWTTSNTILVNKVLTWLPRPLKEHEFNLSLKKNKLIESFDEEKILYTHNQADFISPVVSENLVDRINNLVGIRTTIAVPVIFKGDKLGVMMFNSIREKVTEYELEMLMVFADMVAIAIQNARLYTNSQNQISQLKAKNKELSTIFKITNQIVSTLDPREVAQRSVDAIPSEMGYFGGIIQRYNEDTGEVVPIAVTETAFEKQILEILQKEYKDFTFNVTDEAVSKQLNVVAIQSREPQKADSLIPAISPPVPESAAELINKLIKTKSVLAYPIMSRNKVIGSVTFVITDKTLEQLTQEDYDLMQTFTYQIGIGMENAQLYEDSQELSDSLEKQNLVLEAKNKELDTIFRITNQIVSTLDPNEVAQRAVNSVPLEMGIYGAILSKIDRSKSKFELLAMTEQIGSAAFDTYVNENNPFCLITNKPNTISEYIMFKEDQFSITDNMVEALGAVCGEELSENFQKLLGIQTIVTVPLRTRNEVTGLVTFFLADRKVDQLNEEDFDLMQTFANQAAIGLENARLFSEYQELSKSLQTKNQQLEAYAQKERDILDIMGHELRTPITIVRNSLAFLTSYILQEDYDQEKMQKYIKIALRSTRREINIIETMLAATKVEADKITLSRSEVVTHEVIEESLEGQKHIAQQKGLDVQVSIADGIGNIYADRSRIQEVFDNLLSNAVKYTQEGTVSISAYEEGENIVFSV
ncbi:GAF domain-containing protein, partial [Candidatus Dojkabacteria bacterium]|nr:GAF domain-containing protein [Candidatus Dojkabacteria bacterium]